MSNTNTLTGKIKFWNSAKGFGFLTEDQSGKEYFSHITNVNGNEIPNENDEVTFEISEGKRGPAAVNITLL
jgi:CspA family cold shock protein